VIQATGETHKRFAIPGVLGIQRNIAITPCFQKQTHKKSYAGYLKARAACSQFWRLIIPW
jgi:hypothetical protein